MDRITKKLIWIRFQFGTLKFHKTSTKNCLMYWSFKNLKTKSFKHKTEEQKQIEEQELKYKSNLEKSEKIFTDSRKILEEFFAKPGNLVTEENFDEKYNAMIQNEVDYNFAIDKFGNKIAEGFQELWWTVETKINSLTF